MTFERATRSRIAADHASARALRRSVQAIWNDPVRHGDGAGLAILIDAALTAVAYAVHWHRTRRHAQQEAAAEQALVHLQAAYAQVAEPVLVGLAHRSPGLQSKRRYAHHLQKAVPKHAERILHDRAWDALATVLAEAEAAGHNASALLDQAVRQRTLDDARSPSGSLKQAAEKAKGVFGRRPPSPRERWIRRCTTRHAPSNPPTGPRASAGAAPRAWNRCSRPTNGTGSSGASDTP
jgi:hypothetical protein